MRLIAELLIYGGRVGKVGGPVHRRRVDPSWGPPAPVGV